MFQKDEETVDARAATTHSRRWQAFSVLALAVLIVVLDHMVLNVALPTLQRQMGATLSELQWIVDAYMLAFAALLLTMGALGDRIGHTAMLRAGMSVFGLASLSGAFAGSAWHLIAARVFMGVGAAMIMPATLALISSIFPPEERGKAIGAWGAMNGLGVVLGPLLGGGCLSTLTGVRYSSLMCRSSSRLWSQDFSLYPKAMLVSDVILICPEPLYRQRPSSYWYLESSKEMTLIGRIHWFMEHWCRL
ncbi:MAG: MFS transporter [Acetobacter sp.]|nr:MFS transporter [Acetobacter sp.]